MSDFLRDGRGDGRNEARDRRVLCLLRRAIGIACPTFLACLTACDSVDYDGLARYYEREPRTVVVLPARNLTTEVEAPIFFSTTIAKPLIDRGYYVLPVGLTSTVLAHEGLTDELAWKIPPERLQQFLGADAVLYVTVESWDTTYLVFASNVQVVIHYRLVDTRTGELLWESRAAAQHNSGSGGGGGLGALIVMAVDAAITAAAVDYMPLARQANLTGLQALPPGAYHRDHDGLLEEIREHQERERASATTE